MRKLILIILLSFAYSSYGQATAHVGNAGDTVQQAGSYIINQALRLPSLSNLDSTYFLATDAQGKVILLKVPAAGGSGSGTVTSVTAGGYSLGGTFITSGTITPDTSAHKLATKTDLNSYYLVSNPNGYTNNTGTVTSIASGFGTNFSTITTTGSVVIDSAAMATRARVQKAIDSLNAIIATKGSGTVTSVATGYGVTGGTIITSGTLVIDSAAMATRARVQKAIDSLNAIIATKGTGTVTSASSGNLAPIFTSTVTTATTTPAIAYTLSNAGAYSILCNTTNGSAAPAYSGIDMAHMVYGITSTANGGTGTSVTTSVNGTPITYGNNNTLTVGTGTVTNVIGGTNINISGTSTIQPTVNITGAIAPANGGTGIANNAASTITISGSYPLTATLTSTTNITVPTSGTLYGTATGSVTSSQFATTLSDETGTGVSVFNNKPTFLGTIQTITAVSAQAFDGSLGNLFTRTLAASETFTQSNFSTGQNFIVKVKQGSGTSYTATWWSGITWITSGATAPVQTTTTNGYTTYGFTCTGSNTFDGYLIGTQ